MTDGLSKGEKIRQEKINILKRNRKDRFKHEPMSKEKEFLLMSFAAILMAFSSHFFKYPNDFVIGGVEGLSIIFAKYINIAPANITLAVNVLLLIIAYFFIGKKFVVKTGYVSILNSVTAIALNYIFPINGTLTDNKLLELILAVLVTAFGSTILFNLSASSGGTDIVAIILKKFTNMDIGKNLLMVDSVLTVLSIYIFGVEIGLLSCLGLIMKGVFVDEIVQAFNTGKFFIIITSKPEEVGKFIRDDLNRSATVISGKGLYEGKDRTVYFCVTSKYEAGLFRNFIKEIDPSCFITVLNTSHIIGKGFFSSTIMWENHAFWVHLNLLKLCKIWNVWKISVW